MTGRTNNLDLGSTVLRLAWPVVATLALYGGYALASARCSSACATTGT